MRKTIKRKLGIPPVDPEKFKFCWFMGGDKNVAPEISGYNSIEVFMKFVSDACSPEEFLPVYTRLVSLLRSLPNLMTHPDFSQWTERRTEGLFISESILDKAAICYLCPKMKYKIGDLITK